MISLPKQLTFAAYRTTNEVLTNAQKDIPAELKNHLHIRGNWMNPRTRFGINVVFAKRNKLEGSVGTAADWLLEEEGYHHGVKNASGLPNKAGYTPKGLSIPNIGNARPSLLAKMPPGQKAGKLLANAKRTKAFIVTSKNGKRIVLQRVGQTSAGELLRDSRGNLRIGRKSERTGGTKVVVKAVLQTRVHVPTPEIFQKTGVRSMNSTQYGLSYGRNLIMALKSAKTTK